MHKILIVEDEIMVQTYLKDNLESHYDIVGTAVSGEEAVEKALKFLPDIILMDINLEGKIDGIEAAKRITDKHDIAILFLTSRSDDDALERARLVKPFGYIIKPVDLNVLKANIDIAVFVYNELLRSPLKVSEKSGATRSGLDDINDRVSKSVEEVSMHWKDKNRIEIVNNRFLKQFWILDS